MIKRIKEKYLNFFFLVQNKGGKMNKWIELLLGLILVIVPIALAINNIYGSGTAAIEFLKGGIIVGVILIGLLFIMLGVSDMKS